MAEPQLRWSIGANDNSRAAFQSFTANIRRGQQEMRAFTAASDAGFGRFTANLRRSSAELAGFSNHMRGVVASFATIAGADFALRAVQQIGDLAEAAQKAGVSVADLQKLVFAGIGTGVSQDSIVGMMAMFNRRIGEAAVKGGELKDLLTANGVAIRDGNGAVEDSVTLLTRVADLVKNAKSEQEKSVIAMMAMGRSGAELIPFLNQGGDAIRRMMQNAEDSGYVFKTELVDRADEFADRWTMAARVVQNILTKSAAEIALEFDALIKPAIALDDFLRRTTGKGLTMEPLSDIMYPEQKAQRARDENQKQIEELERQAAERRAAVAEFNRVYPAIPGMTREMTLDETELIDIERQIASLKELRRTLPVSLSPEDRFRTDRAPRQIDVEIPKKKAATEREAARATNEHKEAVDRLKDAIKAQKEAQEQLTNSMDEFRDDAMQPLRDFVGILKDGKIEAQELAGWLSSIGDKLLNRGIDRLGDLLFGAQGTTDPGLLGASVFGAPKGQSFAQLGTGLSDVMNVAPETALTRFQGSAAGRPASTGSAWDKVTSTPIGQIGGDSVQARAWSFWKSKGLTDAQVAGIMGNIGGESAFDPTAVGDSGNAYGLYQHNGPRRRALFDFAGTNLPTEMQQHQFAYREVMQNPGYQGILKAGDTGSATRIFGKQFEAPANLSASIDKRISIAQQAMEKFQGSVSNIAATAQSSASEISGGFAPAISSIVSAVGGAGAGAAPAGGGGFMSILQTLLQFLPAFAGGFAEGGHVPAGQWGILGERGPEPVFGGRSGVDVIPFDAMPSRRGGSRNNVVIGGATININGSADEQTVAMIDRRLAEHSVRQQAQLDRRINRIAQRNNAYYA